MLDAILKFFRESPILTGLLFVAIFALMFGWQSIGYAIAVEIFHFFYFIVITSGSDDDDDWFDPRGPRYA